MVRHLQKRLTAGLLALTMVLSSVLMPAQAAFATAPVGDVPLVEQQVQSLPEVEEQVEVLTEVASIDKDHKTTLCHATNSATNPYVEITVDYNAFTKQGHDGHEGPVAMTVAMAQQLKAEKIDWGDIIPAVPQWDYPGKNVPAGQTILENSCAVPEGEPKLVVLPTQLKTVDPCGLENAYLDTTPLDGIVGLTYEVQLDGSVKVEAEDGFLLTLNGKTTFTTYVYDPAKDSGKLCKVEAVMPEFKDRCGTSKDFFRVKATDYVDYYWGDTKLNPGKKYWVTDASMVVIKAVSSDEDYKIVGQKKFKYQFTDELCKPKANLQVAAECVGLDTSLTTMLKNPTNSMQYYEVVVTNAGGTELETKQVELGAKATEYLKPKIFMGDGEFTVWVYSFNKEKRGKLLAQQVLVTECEDTFTPEIYKVNQDGAVLPDGVFNVEVCQEYGYRANVLFDDEEEDGCETYVGVTFGYDGDWFEKNVEYEPFVPTTVTITEVSAPQGCKASGPWMFEWNYTQQQDGVFALLREEGPRYMDGSWNVEGNTFYLENECDTPGQGGTDPVEVLPETTETPQVVTLAETGDSRTALVTFAAFLMLVSAAMALSPFVRRSES